MKDQNSIINAAAEVLIKAKKEVKELLDQLPHSNLSLATDPALQSIINRLFFLSGTTQKQETTGAVEFPPVTNFMGEEIVYPKQIRKEDISPKEADRQIFVDKVNRLYEEFTSISPDGLLNSYTIPEDQLVIRGVAKKAGVPQYAERAINLQFIDEITNAITKQKGEQSQQAVIDAAIKEQEEKEQQEIDRLKTGGSEDDLNDPFGGEDDWGNDDDENEDEYDGPLVDHVVTEKDMELNPELAEQGIKVGDTISIPEESAENFDTGSEAPAEGTDEAKDSQATKTPPKGKRGGRK